AYMQDQVYLAIFCFTLAGALLGFLWYNAYPAQLFMGDTGSLALGATLALVSIMTGQWLLLPMIGLVFAAETISVMLQVGYFKLTRRMYGEGRRLFKMSPLHHHFELLGWSEMQVKERFFIASVLAGMLGVALALI
ncbi:MAG: phospho-N-acetylmuramoyl-pentapeptide-transferase, partial [Caldilineaceae bacterium]|nr:phospho-N-acetylmuramoyl-pentapeptide-transferase [Caldilineaceae bacterium]